MRGRKQYGQGKADNCLFCGSRALQTNKQGAPVCKTHSSAVLNDMKCVCGQYLDIRTSKWGMFFTCIDCGAQSMSKVFEFNTIKDVSEKTAPKPTSPRPTSRPSGWRPQNKTGAITKKKHVPKEITITSDDAFYFS